MKVKFLPQSVEFNIESNESVLKLASKNGIFIKSICNSLPSCAECRIKIVEGDHNVLPPSSKELQLIGSGYFVDQRRLSCQVYCFGDIVVDLSEQIQKEKELLKPRQPSSFIRKKESETSMALMGNLIEQEKELLKEAKEIKEEDFLEETKGVNYTKDIKSIKGMKERQSRKNRKKHRIDKIKNKK